MFTFPVYSVKNLVGSFGPHEWVFAPVPSVDEGADLGCQVADRGEGPASDRLAFDDAVDAEWILTPWRRVNFDPSPSE